LNKTYDVIGKDIVDYSNEKGSPVVPGSCKKVFEDNENVMFSIVILKYHYVPGHYDGDIFVSGTSKDFLEPLKIAFREKKFILREFFYDGNKSNSIDGQIDVAKQQVDQTLSSMMRWCQIHYGEVYSGWIHLKVIRGFVESVLRYGLPVNFLSFFLEPNMQREKQIKASLCTAISKLRPELVYKKSEDDEEESEETDNLPFVCQKFSVIGAVDVK
jgi:V-type H+-transporting ATPase subunit C